MPARMRCLLRSPPPSYKAACGGPTHRSCALDLQSKITTQHVGAMRGRIDEKHVGDHRLAGGRRSQDHHVPVDALVEIDDHRTFRQSHTDDAGRRPKVAKLYTSNQ